MGIDSADDDSLLDMLWRSKLTILLVLALLIVMAAGAYFYKASNDKSTQLMQKDSDYKALSDKYDHLANDHTSLIKDNNDLNARYDNLSNRYNKLSVDDSYLKEAYQGLNGTVSSFQETGGAVIALYYKIYQSGTQSSPKKTVEATAYNVGNKTAGSVTIKCRTIFNGSASISQQTFSNVPALDKKHSQWDFSNDTQIDQVWVES